MFTVPRFAFDVAKPGGGMTVRAIEVVVVNAPELPPMVTVDVPRVAEPLAVNVSTLAPVAGFGLNEAVTPLGDPVANRFTLPVNPYRSVTVIPVVLEAPWAKVTEDGEAPRAKLGAELIVRASVVVAFNSSEVPVMVTVAVPVVAESLAVSVSALAPVAGLGLKDAVTPLGSPVAVRVTPPVKPLSAFTVTVDVLELPWMTVKEVGAALRVKPGAV